MNSTPDFDSETHDYDVLLKGSSSVESISNGATPAVIQAAHMQAAVQVAHESPSSPHIASMTAQQQQHHLQQQRQQMGDSAMPSSTSPPAMAPIPRGPTFMGSSGVSEVKLKRFLEHNQRLREHLEMRRIPVSEASNSLIQFVTTTRDALIPSLWGTSGSDPFAKQSSGCCHIC